MNVADDHNMNTNDALEKFPARKPDLPSSGRSEFYVAAMEQLVAVVQELSHARDLASVMTIVRTAARRLTHADGATFVLRDGDCCYYAEEDAISPLWKGKRFPMPTCISGWVMMNAQPAVIEDIYVDPRIPADAYRPTFVKSLAMVPIRKEDPIGAIGNYWAQQRKPTEEEVQILQALAGVTAVAIENANLYEELQGKIKALQGSNEELSRFAWIASHDLKSPLRAISNLSQWIEEDTGEKLNDASKDHMQKLRHRVRRMEKLLDDILEYAHMERRLKDRSADVVTGDLLISDCLALVNVPEGFSVKVSDGMKDIRIARMPVERIFCNLIDNAIKHHDKKRGVISVDGRDDGDHYAFTVADDGPGIDPRYHQKIFEMLQTLKARDVKEGSGMGLALVRKILSVYGGDVQVESGPGRGTVFRFTWPKNIQQGNGKT